MKDILLKSINLSTTRFRISPNFNHNGSPSMKGVRNWNRIFYLTSILTFQLPILTELNKSISCHKRPRNAFGPIPNKLDLYILTIVSSNV